MGLSFFKATGIPVEKFTEKLTLTGELVDPADVGELVAYLASERARNITGQVIVVDSGQMLAPSPLSFFDL
jgi:NAD(P)-dependent dehydrogenase (short-subunit alcohol dehydrogenase family)